MKKILEKNIKGKIKEYIKIRIKENIREYLIFTMVLLIGIIIGIVVLNNTSEEQKQQISDYMIDFTENIKSNSKIDYFAILQNSLLKNLKFTILIIFISLSIFNIIGDFILIAYKGFCLGYTLSSVIAIFGTLKGLIYGISLVFLNNLIYIPALFYLIIDSLKLYKNINDLSRKDKRKAILEYLITVVVFFIIIIISSIITTYVNTNIFLRVIKNQ